MFADEVVHDAAVTTGTLLMDSVLAVVLFDSSSTHTFITQTSVLRIGVGLKDLNYDLVVTAPARAIFTTIECVRGVTLAIY